MLALTELPKAWLVALAGNHLSAEDAGSLRATCTMIRRVLPLTSVLLCPDTPLEYAQLLGRSSPESSVPRLRVQFLRSPYWSSAPTPAALAHTRRLLAAAAPGFWPGVQQLVLVNAAREDLEALADLPPWPQLRSVRVEGFGACTGEEEAARLAALGGALARWPTLEVLTLVPVGCTQELDAAALEAVAQHVAPHCQKLKAFEVLLPPRSPMAPWTSRKHQGSTPYKDQAREAFIALAASTCHWRGLEHLTLPYVCLSAAAVEQLAQHVPQLQALRLENCSTVMPHEMEATMIAQALAGALAAWAPQLRVLHIPCDMTAPLPHHGAELGAALAACQALEELRLPGRWMCRDVLDPLRAQPPPALLAARDKRRLAEALPAPPRVRGALNGNPDHDHPRDWCSALARQVLQPQQLAHVTRVCVTWLHIGDEGACTLAAALACMPQLRRLTADGCAIGAAGGASLMAALGLHCPQLRELDLEGNPGMGDAAVQRFVPRHPPSQLEFLQLGHCGLTAAACEALCSQRWPRLQGLVLDKNFELGQDAARVLAGAWQQFPVLNILSIKATGMGAFPPPEHAHRWPMLWWPTTGLQCRPVDRLLAYGSAGLLQF